MEAGPQPFLVEMPIPVAEPMVAVLLSLVSYGLQEGFPALTGRSYRAGCLGKRR
jgi:hypothetical protein